MSKNTLLISLLMVCAGCSTTGIASKAEFSQITPGMTRAEVVSLLGEPGNRTFSGEDEAIQYCRTGWASDEYTTIWIESGIVTAMTTQNAAISHGLCSGRFPPADWGQMPADISIEVN